MQYAVYTRPTQGVEVIKRGFSWPAMCFNIYWALHKRLWGIAAAFLALVLSLALVFTAVFLHYRDYELPVASAVVLIEFMGLAFMGARGNQWLEAAMRRRGYLHHATIEAENWKAASLKAPNAAQQSAAADTS